MPLEMWTGPPPAKSARCPSALKRINGQKAVRSGKIRRTEVAEVEKPSVRTPHPVRYRRVHDCAPKNAVDEDWKDASSFRGAASTDDLGDRREHGLVEHVEQCGNLA